MKHPRRSRCSLVASLIVAGLVAFGAQGADVIGINLRGSATDANQTLAAGDAAGVVATGNWNNVAFNGTVDNLSVQLHHRAEQLRRNAHPGHRRQHR